MLPRKRFTLHAATAALLCAAASQAGDVTIRKIDLASGALAPWVQATMEHAPARLLERGEPWLLDSCGQVFGFSEGTFGEMSLNGPLTPLHSLQGVRHLAVSDLTGVAIDDDGKLLRLVLDANVRRHRGTDFSWLEDTGSTIPAADTALLVHTRAADGVYLFKTNGDLMKIEAFGEYQDRGRYLGARGGWQDVTQAIVSEMPAGRNNLLPVLVTLHTDGSLRRHVIEPTGDGNYALQTAQVDGDWSDTRALLPAPGHNHSRVLRLTERGDLYRLDVVKGTEERLGEAGAFADGIVSAGRMSGYFVTAAGTFSNDCPEPEVAAEVIDPNADFDAAAVTDAFDAMNEKARAFSTAVNERVETHPPDGLLGKSEAEIDAAMNAFMTELAAFERGTLTPILKEAEAFKARYARYGDFDALYDLVREKSDYEYRIDDPLPEIERQAQAYREYRAGLSAYVLAGARIQFQIAEAQSDAEEKAKNYREAVPIAQWALRLDPQNTEARGYLEKAGVLADAAISAEKAAIAAATWPEDTEHCECDLDEFKARALNYFERTVGKEEYRDGRRVVAVRIRSAMKPGETNVLGQILNWHVRAWIATTRPDEPWFLTVQPVEFDTETNDRASRFSGYHLDGDEYAIPIERVAIDDEDALEESLRIIEETTGLTPNDMPDDAMDPSVTGVPNGDGGGPGGGGGADAPAPDAPDHASTREESVPPGSENAGETRADAPESAAGAAGAAVGRLVGGLLLLVLAGGAVWLGRRWRGRIAERIARHLPADRRQAWSERLQAARERVKATSADAARKAREAGGAVAERAREAGEQARRKAETLRKP